MRACVSECVRACVMCEEDYVYVIIDLFIGFMYTICSLDTVLQSAVCSPLPARYRAVEVTASILIVNSYRPRSTAMKTVTARFSGIGYPCLLHWVAIKR